MFARPQTVHKWFDQLIGEWSFEQVCNLPDGGREMWWRSSGTIVYFSCTDCGVEASRIEAAGGKVQMPKSPIGQYGFIALGIDTEGNCFGLHNSPANVDGSN